MSRYTFQHVTDRQTLLAVGRLRYEVFIEERGCPLPEADHDNRLLLDALDEEIMTKGSEAGVIIAAYQKDELAGTVRLNSFCPATQLYQNLYKADQFHLTENDHPCITTRLCTDLSHRNSHLGISLIKEAYKAGLEQHITINFSDCNEPLLKLFKRFGFREYTSPVVHPGFGLIYPVVLLMEDTDHFTAIRSPFLQYESMVQADLPSLNRLRARIRTLQHTYSSSNPVLHEHNT